MTEVRQMEYVQSFKYDKKNFNDIKNYQYGKNWPVVYILEGNREAYVGETTDVYMRSQQHYLREDRRALKSLHIITDEDFNKSATLDIESSLIEYIAADGLYKLQNGNAGLTDHNYFDREHYQSKFEEIWDELRKKSIVDKELVEIRNSDLFKYSPYKSLSEDQYLTARSIINEIVTHTESRQLVKGEPGTGKTILAIYLMKYLKQKDETKNLEIGIVIPRTSLRGTIKKVFRSVHGLKSSMVIGPNDVVKKKYDLLIVDEAHRLNRRINITNMKSFDDVNRKLGLEINTGDQLDWILRSSRHSILFYDGNQSVKPSDIPRERIENYPSIIHTIESQMRVLGRKDYLDYIQKLLLLDLKKRQVFDSYELLLFEDVADMVNAIKIKNKEYGLSRIVAGYAWEWKSKNDTALYDIQISGNFFRWNTTNKDWVNSKNAINEVGCIHTIQGYDLNYTGVIVGAEIAYRLNEIVINKDHYYDINGKKSVDDGEILKNYILNIYKTLLTRGIKGTYIYVCDEKLREYFQRHMTFIEKKHDTKIVSENHVSNREKVAEEKGEYR